MLERLPELKKQEMIKLILLGGGDKMSKSILLSIRPQWVAKILNEEKTIEVRKRFPKDYVGWVYIYCTKDYKKILFENGGYGWRLNTWNKNKNVITTNNGKVVARFWCDNVEEIDVYTNRIYETKTLNQLELLEKSCLTHCELFEYLGEDYSKKGGYAIHISKLEIFNRPKYLTEYYKSYIETEKGIYYQVLTKAPQNLCYIEGEE